MSVSENPFTGETLFRCRDPKCGFRGDAVSLYSEVKRISIKDTLERFRPGMELAHTLLEPLKESEVKAYLDNDSSQVRFSAFVSKCQQALRKTPEKCLVRPGISSISLGLIPPELGLMINQDLPDEIKKLGKSVLSNENLLVCPYTYNNLITHLEICDCNFSDTRRRIQVTRSDVGVFLEDFEEVPERLLVTDDPLVSVILYGNLKRTSGKKPPIIAASGFPLPNSFSETKFIRLFSTEDHPLSLEYAVSVLSKQEIVAGTNIQPHVDIWECHKKTIDILEEDVVRCFEQNNLRTASLEKWIARKINALYSEGKLSEISSVMNKYPVSETARNILCSEIEKSGYNPELKEFIAPKQSTYAENIVLGNGRTVLSEPTELCVVGNHGKVYVLCNVGFKVDSKIKSYDGSEILVCTITPSDASIPSMKVQLPESVWNKAGKIQNIVTKAFTNRGFTPYVAFYDTRYCTWRDVLSKLSENCVLHQEVTELGLDEFSDLHLPEFILRNSGAIEKQTQIFTLPEPVLRAYSGISADCELGFANAFIKLFNSCNNLYISAFTCGLLHVLYQMTYGRYRPLSAKKHAHRHLFFVETEPGIWSVVFKQLSNLFSGDDFVPTVNYSDPGSTFKDYRTLGTLPLICSIPSMGNKLAKAIDENSLDVMGLVDSTTAVMTNGHVSATYLTPSSEENVSISMIDPNAIDEIRKAFPAFLQWYTKNADISSAYRTAQLPCISVFHECCRLLQIDPCPSCLLERIAKSYFPGVGMTGVTTFFDMMHRAVVSDDRRRICVIHDAPEKGCSFTRRGQHVFVMKESVIIGHNVVEYINKESMGKFSVEQLTEELTERQLLVPIPYELDLDPKRCWCIGRETWESEIIRPPITIDPLGSSEIKLQELA